MKFNLDTFTQNYIDFLYQTDDTIIKKLSAICLTLYVPDFSKKKEIFNYFDCIFKTKDFKNTIISAIEEPDQSPYMKLLLYREFHPITNLPIFWLEVYNKHNQ